VQQVSVVTRGKVSSSVSTIAAEVLAQVVAVVAEQPIIYRPSGSAAFQVFCCLQTGRTGMIDVVVDIGEVGVTWCPLATWQSASEEWSGTAGRRYRLPTSFADRPDGILFSNESLLTAAYMSRCNFATATPRGGSAAPCFALVGHTPVVGFVCSLQRRAARRLPRVAWLCRIQLLDVGATADQSPN